MHGKLQMSQLPSSTLLDLRDENISEEKALHVAFTNSPPQAVVATGGVGPVRVRVGAS